MFVEIEQTGILDKILINDIEYTDLFSLDQLRPFNKVTFVGTDLSINKLVLDGIDTRYFVHHGFTSAGHRGNNVQNSGKIWYYFKLPIWQWYMDFIEHDNSYFRQISKAYSGFTAI